MENKSEKTKSTSKKPILIILIIMFLSFIFLIPSRIFASYCSSTCSKNNKDWCCQNVDSCLITKKVCKSLYYNGSGSVRRSSSGSRNPVGGGTSFGK